MHLSLLSLFFLAFHLALAGHHLDDPDLFHFVTVRIISAFLVLSSRTTTLPHQTDIDIPL